MYLKTLCCGAALVCAILAGHGLHAPPRDGGPLARILCLTCAPASDDGEKGDKSALSGTWGKKDGEMRIEFADKAVMKLAPHGESAMIAILCKYTVEKEGRVKAEVTGFEGKDDLKKMMQEHVAVGLAFSFAWKVKGETARLDDLKGNDVTLLKSHLEGDFEKK